METTQERNKQAVRALYERCINRGDSAALESLIAPEYEGPQGVRGPAGYAASVDFVRASFPDVQFMVHDLIAEDDKVCVRWSWRGSHKGTFAGITATERTVDNTGIAIYQLRERKIVRSWLEIDRLGVLQQLQAGRPPASP